MDALRRFKDLHGEITPWRRDLHAHPEILFETPRTGVVDVLNGSDTTSGKVVALREEAAKFAKTLSCRLSVHPAT